MSVLDLEWWCTGDDFRCRNVLIGLVLPLSHLRLIPIRPRRLSWNRQLLRLCRCKVTALALRDTS